MAETDFSEQIRDCAGRIAQYGPACMAGLFDLTSHRLVRFAITITRNQHDAEDAVQTALATIAGRPSVLFHSDHPWHYLLKMVRNESLMVLRKRKRWSLGISLNDLLSTSPCDNLQQEEMHRAVWLALRSLPSEQRQVVVLKIWEDLTFQEIAVVIDCTLQTAASRYRYAIQKLTPKLRSLQKEAVGHA